LVELTAAVLWSQSAAVAKKDSSGMPVSLRDSNNPWTWVKKERQMNTKEIEVSIVDDDLKYKAK